MEEYQRLYRSSIEDPDAFWAEQAGNYLSWERKWEFVLQYDFDAPRVEWFGGAVLNASYNCVDRHLDKSKNKVAYYWEGDDPHQSRTVTYSELYAQVNKFAAVLRSRGVGKGDRVLIYLPMIVELPVSMLACARLGAIHSVVCWAFGPEAVSWRIQDCAAKVVITAAGVNRAGKATPLRDNLDMALQTCPEIEAVIVVDNCRVRPALSSAKELWWHEAVNDPSLPDFIEPEPMGSEDPLFILYTSGNSGKPLAVVHTHGGYLLYAAMTTKLVFDLKEDETFWFTGNIGRIAGHSYSVYGPLLNGFTSVLFEGAPTYPAADRLWQIVAKHRIDKFSTSAHVIRSLAAQGTEHVSRHDISSLKMLGSMGQPLDQDAWQWYHEEVGQGRCPIVDTWLQTETGGHLLASLPGAVSSKPGSCCVPLMGVQPVILDPDTGEETQFPNQEGALFIRKPWPGIARTLFRDHERFKEVYFSRYPGLFFTGEGAKEDEKGFYCIIGRIDEVINAAGFRVAPAEVETALVAHPAVSEAAVVGYPHSTKGEGLYAFVILTAGAVGSGELKTELRQLVRRRIAPMAVPDAIQWADGLPKTRSGKVLRQLLRKIAAGAIQGIDDIAIISDPSVVENLIRDRLNMPDG